MQENDVHDEAGFYKCQVGEHIGYRYELEKVLDAGAFGIVA